jgi:predicted ATP-dependent endonuclease of OLD family
MKIRLIEISNFRRLKSVRLELADEITLFVGANNSGKTTAMDALQQFLKTASFRLSDFTLSDLPALKGVGDAWEADTDEHEDVWDSVLPSVDVWIETEESELHRATQLLPIIDGFVGLVGVRLRLEAKDLNQLRASYVAQRAQVKATLSGATPEQQQEVSLWPADFLDFLDRKLPTTFHVACYPLEPARISPPIYVKGTLVGLALDPERVASNSAQALQPGQIALDSNPLNQLVRVDVVNAQRGLGSEDGNSRLSRQVSDYYDKHLDATKSPTLADLNAIHATQRASRSFDERLDDAFKLPLDEISNMGYPGSGNPRVVIRTSLNLTDGLKHNSVLKYRLDEPADGGSSALLELPENLNGLGYQNLVLMIFNLLGFRDARLNEGKAASEPDGTPAEVAPIHLVLVEEPEAHLHAQVQQVFIRRAYDTLKPKRLIGRHPDLETQLVVSTHSGHIAHETDFAGIRYFRRNPPGEVQPIPTSDVRDLSEVFGAGDDTSKFVTRFIKLDHCDLLFADAAVLFEGAAERVLLPHFIEKSFPKIHESYVEYLEIGGSHAHRLKGLIDTLGIPVLVITDIDAKDSKSNTKARPTIGSSQVTGNSTIEKWLGASNMIDDLSALNSSDKVLNAAQGGVTYFAYQTETDVSRKGASLGSAIASTFEDAIVLSNIDAFSSMTGKGLVKKFADAAVKGGSGEEVAAALYEALKTGEKAAFALDLLWADEFEQIVPPKYIGDGLDWLSEQVAALPIVPSVPTSEDAAPEMPADVITNQGSESGSNVE